VFLALFVVGASGFGDLGDLVSSATDKAKDMAASAQEAASSLAEKAKNATSGITGALQEMAAKAKTELESAVAKTQKAVAEAKDKLQAGLAKATDAVKAAVESAKTKMKESWSKAADKFKDVVALATEMKQKIANIDKTALLEKFKGVELNMDVAVNEKMMRVSGISVPATMTNDEKDALARDVATEMGLDKDLYDLTLVEAARRLRARHLNNANMQMELVASLRSETDALDLAQATALTSSEKSDSEAGGTVSLGVLVSTTIMFLVW